VSQSQPPIRAVIAPVTPLQQNCTIVWCAKTLKAAVIDPGGEVPRLMKALADQGLTLEKIWITHGHMDHAGGAAELKRLRRQVEELKAAFEELRRRVPASGPVSSR